MLKLLKTLVLFGWLALFAVRIGMRLNGQEPPIWVKLASVLLFVAGIPLFFVGRGRRMEEIEND
jgi:hypothetical protein